MAPIPREVIEAARSERGGFTRAQLAAWGVPWPPPHGWKRRLETVGPGPVCPRCHGAGVLPDADPTPSPTRAASPHDPPSPCRRQEPGTTTAVKRSDPRAAGVDGLGAPATLTRPGAGA